ncbi:hypothetical protein IW261DRAFT_1672342 [Armillaria novae-zelandiae]|uniref:Uncharacterized protein n=1 Tax=Armillaria novae-zelandiae TaxID=153914 RepID=A0AA39NS58_9AGAR|nr:hypothetical protein IW261DRAFT_1672342 [Armillaria novae-zelandiae]
MGQVYTRFHARGQKIGTSLVTGNVRCERCLIRITTPPIHLQPSMDAHLTLFVFVAAPKQVSHKDNHSCAPEAGKLSSAMEMQEEDQQGISWAEESGVQGSLIASSMNKRCNRNRVGAMCQAVRACRMFVVEHVSRRRTSCISLLCVANCLVTGVVQLSHFMIHLSDTGYLTDVHRGTSLPSPTLIAKIFDLPT